MRVGNQIGDDGTASLAPSLGRMTRLTMLKLSGTLDACNALMTLHAVGRGGCALVAAGGGVCEGRAEGRRCVQTINRSEMMGWHG